MTAAHCVAGYVPRNFGARLGAHRTTREIASPQETEIPVGYIVVHQNYSRPRPFANDIALLRYDAALLL